VLGRKQWTSLGTELAITMAAEAYAMATEAYAMAAEAYAMAAEQLLDIFIHKQK